ncbi:MerC domain-containing protein [Tahibacter amnicola]|uniref:MerC domain-containing protein n=1 Tax=Tahibacter amnicola TaxID=2976241 RepID=A0ABY6BAJ5_9GAMM|nr:MerC domain-containing protein [Tahibacter amnicola]UXI67083.1 MerC domain-containing protein [Tahibacter amnicola]
MRPSHSRVNAENTPPPADAASHRLARFADRFGATASFLCAVHCALLPFVIALLPAIGLGFLADHGIERGFVTFACVLATVTLYLGYRRHGRALGFGLLVPGIALLLTGVLVDFDSYAGVHAVLVSAGGTLVALAHVLNLRLTHVHTELCRHG